MLARLLYRDPDDGIDTAGAETALLTVEPVANPDVLQPPLVILLLLVQLQRMAAAEPQRVELLV